MEAATILKRLMEPRDSHSDDVERKRDRRSKAAEVVIDPIADPSRRQACLTDPELFLRTYFPTIFFNPFAEHHKAMIRAIHERAISGGDKAVAAPRGDGKTQVAVCMMVYILLATSIKYPVIIASTSKKARKLFGQIKAKFSNRRKYPEFTGDFPEICCCVRELDGAPQRASKQHVDGQKTEIVWTQDSIRFPFIEGSDYSGKRVGFFGLDEAIRGENDEENRPDFALIDDPETREVAFSPTNRHEDIEDMIDGDIAGLAGPTSTISRVVLTTIQNRRCYSFRVTDPKTKPTFAGERYGVLSKWPDNREIWDEYISKRQQGQASGDKDGLQALQFYLDNRAEMEKGAEVTNPSRFNARTNEDGVAVEVSAIQAFFNRVADWGLPRVLAELQNEPEEEETEETLGLTAGRVQSRINGLKQNELPKSDCKITVGIDVGKYYSHWVKIAFVGAAQGFVIDYGVMETPGMKAGSDDRAIQLALLSSLLNWRSDIYQENPPDLVFVDSGSYSEAVYEFTRQAGVEFKPTKGDAGRLQYTGQDTEHRRFFLESRSEYQVNEKLWLFHINVNYWKHIVQQRFITETFNEAHQVNDGTLSLYVPSSAKDHKAYAHHIVAEELEELFIEGKGLRTRWVVKNKNNHWLDATALACCGAAVLGVRTVPRQSLTQTPKQKPKPQSVQSSQRFRQRPGGWIPKKR